MDEIDKQSMGLRIKQIRLQAGMRQWELARLLGTPAFKPGQLVTLKVRRDGRPFEAKAKLGRYE